MPEPYRIERDTMGEMRVPADALYGAQTARAVENFPISRLRFPRSFIRALGLIKSAAARVNGELGELPADVPPRSKRPPRRWWRAGTTTQFVVDIFQTGSGTSTNMNANEVIAQLAGAHPNDDVNRGQSSNDVIPTRHAHRRRRSRARAAAARDARAGRRAGAKGARVRTTSSRSAARICRMRCRCGWARSSAAMRGRWRRRARTHRSGAGRHLRTAAGRHGGGHGARMRRRDSPRAVIAEIARRTGLPFRRGAESLRGAGGARTRS